MDKKIFVEQVVKRLEEMNVPYEIGKQADISISATFKKKQDQNEGESDLFYFALLFLNQENNTVFAYEKIMVGDLELSAKQDCSQIVVNTKDGDNNDTIITIGAIMESIFTIAAKSGLAYQRTENMEMASYSPEQTPVFINQTNSNYTGEEIGGVCPNCAARLQNAKGVCPICGADLQQVAPAQPKRYVGSEPNSEVYREHPNVQYNPQNKQKKKMPFLSIILISILVIGAIIVGVVILSKDSKDSEEESIITSSIDVINESKNSAIVSKGVLSSDLGNIINGQYYFETDKYIFYSSFDENDKAHIYSVKKDGTGLKSIFDGFGWSLVVIEDWLYFSGNQGTTIDGTYHIYRISLDGSQIEKINDKYSYGMFLYGNYLYYMQSSSNSQGAMSICRSSLNGENKEVLLLNGLSPLIYKDMLYYYDNQGNMHRTKPDGTDSQVLLTGVVKTYVLSEEKIVYNDYNNNIYICDLDGKNNMLIRNSSGTPLNSVNAYNGRIFFSEYESNFDYTLYGFPYTIKSCKMDGSDEKTVFSSVSYGIYMNLVNDKLMSMDYVMSTTSGVMNATIKVMNLDGSNQNLLDR